MSELTEYFLRHYTLIIDNTQSTHHAANGRAANVIVESGVTFPEYEAMSRRERADRFASEIGEKIIELITGWYEESVSDRNHPGSQLSGEIMILADSELEWALGDHYMPEPGDVEDLLESGEDSDDE